MKFESIANCFIVIIVNLTVRCAYAGSLRILGGRDARAGEFPYVVSIELVIGDTPGGSSKHWLQCTGSVLTATTTLTATHCCDRFEELVRLGEYDLAVIRYGTAAGKPTKDDRFSNILSCARQPSQRPDDHPTSLDDLALLRTRPIPLPSYARISALDHWLLLGQRVFILGYGATNDSDGKMENTLHLKKPLQVTDAMWSKCQHHRYEPYPGLCAMMPCGRHSSVCGGDSGGPLLHASGIIGVTSKGYDANCDMMSDSHPEAVIAVPLSPHIDWIAAVVKEIPNF